MTAPYYSDESVTLYHGDCLEVMAGMDAVDLVVTSPPYNKGKQSGDYANMRGGYRSYSDDLPDADYLAWQHAVVRELWRLTADAGAIFYNHKPQIREGVALLPTRYVPQEVTLRQVIIWDRRGGMNWNASFFVPQHEWVLLLAHPAFRLRDRGASATGDVWDLGIDQGADGHPCAFPESLPMRAIEATTAQVILDPYAGSGTTLEAARRLGRRAIGIELDERYCEAMARRFDQGVLDFGDAS